MKNDKNHIETFQIFATIFIALVITVSVAKSSQLFSAQPDIQDIYVELTQKLFPDNLKKSQTVAVCPFNYASSGIEQFARLVTERMTNAIVASKKCVVLERINLNQILSETKLSLTGAINQQSAVKIGNLMGAKAVVIGSVETDGLEVHVIARLVNVETGQVETSGEVLFSASSGFVGKSEATIKGFKQESKPKTAIPSFFKLVDEEEDKDENPASMVFLNVMNSIIVNIDKHRNYLKDKLVLLDEKLKTNSTPDILAEKTRLTTQLKACEIMMKGFDAWLQNGDEDTYLACFKQALSMYSENPDLLLWDAIVSLANNEKEFTKKVNHVLSISSTSAGGYFLRALYREVELENFSAKGSNAKTSVVAKKAAENKIFKEMTDDIDKYALYSGDSFGAYSFKVYVLLSMKKENNADELIKKAIAENPENFRVYKVRAMYNLLNYGWRALSFKNEKNKNYEDGQKAVDKAIEDYSAMIALDPSGIEGRYERAEAHSRYKEDYKKAISDLNILIETDSSKAWKYFFTRGYYYKKMGQMDDAVNDWKKSLELKPGYKFPLNELSEHYLQEKDATNVLKYFDQYISIMEKKTEPNYGLLELTLLPFADLLSESGQCDRAEIYVNKVRQFRNMEKLKWKRLNIKLSSLSDNDARQTIEKLAKCYENSGAYDKAIEKLQEGIKEAQDKLEYEREEYKTKSKVNKSKPDTIGLQLAYYNLHKLYLSLGGNYFELKKFREAEESYTNSIVAGEKSPYSSNEVAYYNRGLCYANLGNAQEEMSDMKKSCSLGFQDACNYLISH